MTVGQGGTQPQQGVVGGDRGHAMGLEGFHQGEYLLFFFRWAITYLLSPGSVDEMGADLPTLSDPLT